MFWPCCTHVHTFLATRREVPAERQVDGDGAALSLCKLKAGEQATYQGVAVAFGRSPRLRLEVYLRRRAGRHARAMGGPMLDEQMPPRTKKVMVAVFVTFRLL